jgi:hypothetical protein
MRVRIEPGFRASVGGALFSQHLRFAFLFQVSAIGQFAFDSFDDAFEFRFLGCSIFHKNESALAQGLKIQAAATSAFLCLFGVLPAFASVTIAHGFLRFTGMFFNEAFRLH